MTKPDVFIFIILDVKNGNNIQKAYIKFTFLMELFVLHVLLEIEGLN